MPPQVEALVPESQLYSKLLDFERRLDATVTRKTVEFQDAATSKYSKKAKRTLRVFLSNVAADGEDGKRVDGWTLKIEGRLLELPGARRPVVNKPLKFSSFIKRVVVHLENDDSVVSWAKPVGLATDCDGFEIKRQGKAEVPLKVLLYLDESPEKFKLSPDLQKLLDIHTDTLQNIMAGLWQYVKANGLQDQDDYRFINCDDKLQSIFETDRVLFSTVPEYLKTRKLLPLDPLVLYYTVRTDKTYHVGSTAYDIEVEVDDQTSRNLKLAAIAPNAAINNEIKACDEQIASLVHSIYQCKLRRDFMNGFVADPIGFINQWLTSQDRDLQLVIGDTTVNGEELSQKDFYQSETVKEALFHYIQQR